MSILLSLLACTGATQRQPQDLADQAARVADGSADAIGMLAFLNDAGTDLALLDDDVALDSRAAGAIIDWRDGDDAVQGSSDDRSYTTMEQLDARYYVGDSAMNKIQAYALDAGFVPTDDADYLGTWDGVAFTLGEANSVLALSNDTGETYLDDTLGLDSRAVSSIMDARPIATVQELAGLYYVGTSALETLKAESNSACDTPGWDQVYVYNAGDDAWRSELSSGLVAVIDETLLTDDWCGEATGSPEFVKAAIDLFDCEEKGYILELGQGMLDYPSIDWYIEFEVDTSYSYFLSTCEV